MNKTYTILLSYHPNLGPIKATLHKYSERKEDILELYEQWKFNYTKAGYPEMANELICISGVSRKDVDKMCASTGYVGTWYKENILTKFQRDDKIVDFGEQNASMV